MSPSRMRKIALYLEYIAFVLRDESKTEESKKKPKRLLTMTERNKRISQGLRDSWARRKETKNEVSQ